VAVAAVRGPIDGQTLSEAFDDVLSTLKLSPGSYCGKLSENPLRIAADLEQKAAELDDSCSDAKRKGG
jgi:hypothetical protein